MMDKSSSIKSYADIATTNKYKNIVNDWPDLKNQRKHKFTQQESSKSKESKDQVIDTSTFKQHEGSDKCLDQLDPALNTLTNGMERLSTNEVVDEIEVPKSREVIRVERQLRRKNAKLKRNEQRLQEKIAQIREPKSQKVQVVDKMVMERYLSSRKLSPIRDGRQNKFKKHCAVKIDLLDLINTKVVNPIDIRASIQSNKRTVKFTNGTQRHKGKKSEIVKKKYVSKLKRSILLSRLQRKQMNTMGESVSNAGDIIVSKETTSRDNQEPEVQDDKSVVVTTNELSPGVKFSRKFRPYCDNRTSPELLSLTEALLRDIFRFQDRAYNKNEIKARSQRRYVVGFKESMRQLDIGKIKLLIIAPDLEIGGTTEVIEEMKIKCQKADIPYVFSLKRRQLGYVLLKKVPVSCVGLLNYQGSEENSQKLLQLIQEEKLRFQCAMAGSS